MSDASPDEGLAPALTPMDAAAEPGGFIPALGGVAEALHAAREAPWKWARIEALIRMAASDDPRVRGALELALHEPDWVLRKYAASGLGALGASGSEPALRAALVEPHPEVRRAAARALRSVVDLAPDLWLAAAADEDWLVRSTAYEALARPTWLDDPALDLVGVFVGALSDAAWLNRYRAVAALAPLQDPRVLEALLGVLATDPALAPHAARALAGRGSVGLGHLLEHLPGAPPWRRLAIADALGLIDAPAARDALARMLGHPDAEVEAAVLRHGAAMVPHLTLALGDDLWIRRWHAAALLGRVGGAAAGVSLRPLVDDARPEVRLAALGALRRLADPQALPDLVRCLKDPSWHIRLAAAEALTTLGAAGHAEAAQALWQLRDDPRHELRRLAGTA